MRHKLSNVDPVALIGDCAVCGPGVRLTKRYGTKAAYPRCYAAWRQQKRNGARFSDGTKVTLEEEKALRKENGGMCAICKTKPSTVLDHCHKNKVARGYLCRSCNLGLGNFQDNPDYLQAAIDYLSLQTN